MQDSDRFNIYEFIDGEIRFSPTDLHATNYHIVGLDLRSVDEVSNKLKQSDVDFNLPTIFLGELRAAKNTALMLINPSNPLLAECVLVYIETANCNNLLKWLSTNFSSAAFVNYEQVNMNDRFGEVMLSNLRARGCNLSGVESCLSLDTQISRLGHNQSRLDSSFEQFISF